MIKSLLNRGAVSCLLVGLLAVQPVYSQVIEDGDETIDEINNTIEATETNIDLGGLTGSATTLESDRLILPIAEQKLWQTIETEDQLGEYDKRLLTQTLPYLIDPANNLFDQLYAETINGYYQDEQKTSRQFPGASQESQRHLAKAGIITALGTTSCGSQSLFARQLDPAKPLWVHYQLGQSAGLTPTWPFGRSFDAVARQMFWLEGRAFTNRSMTATDWQDFLAQLAIGEIEERLALPPGALANVAIDDLTIILARARIAAALSIPILPEVDSETEFYAALGQRQIELALQLPVHSLMGKSWKAVYQQIGFRVLEEQLALPAPTTAEPLFSGNSPLTDNPRFIALANRLTERSEFYQNPRLAFNLPSEIELASGDRSSLNQRLVNGDAEAFAVAGAWFLTDSLDLSSKDSQTLIRSIAAGEDRPISLASAKGFDTSLSLTELFSAESGPEKRQALFKRLGQGYKAMIEASLPRLNESVLLAVQGNNELPKIDDVINILTSHTHRTALLDQLAKASPAEANYPDALTIEALVVRGQTLLAESLNLTPSEVAELQSPNRSAVAKATGQLIDRVMGWTSGTAFDLAQQANRTASPASLKLQEKRLLQDGANRLWTKIGLTGRLKAALNELYFQGVVTTDLAGFEPEFEDETIDADSAGTDNGTPAADTGQTTDEEGQPDDSGDTTDETVELAIPVEQQSLAEAVALSLTLPLAEIEPILTGHWLPGLIRGSLAILGKELSARANVSGAQLIEIWGKPSAESIEGLQGHSLTIGQAEFMPANFKDRLESAKADNISQLLEQTAAYQWNIACPDKQAEAHQAIDRLIKTLVALPEIDEGNPDTDQPNRPVQILTYSVDDLTEATRQAIDQAYPGADGFWRKWGAYKAARAWGYVYIGY